MTDVIITAALSLLGGILTNAFYYGKLTQKVRDSSDDIHILQSDVKNHERRIGRLEGLTGD